MSIADRLKVVVFLILLGLIVFFFFVMMIFFLVLVPRVVSIPFKRPGTLRFFFVLFLPHLLTVIFFFWLGLFHLGLLLFFHYLNGFYVFVFCRWLASTVAIVGLFSDFLLNWVVFLNFQLHFFLHSSHSWALYERWRLIQIKLGETQIFTLAEHVVRQLVVCQKSECLFNSLGNSGRPKIKNLIPKSL